ACPGDDGLLHERPLIVAQAPDLDAGAIVAARIFGLYRVYGAGAVFDWTDQHVGEGLAIEVCSIEVRGRQRLEQPDQGRTFVTQGLVAGAVDREARFGLDAEVIGNRIAATRDERDVVGHVMTTERDLPGLRARWRAKDRDGVVVRRIATSTAGSHHPAATALH